MALSTRQREVLDLEREWWRWSPTKKAAILDRLGCSPAAYYAVLRRLTPSEDALRYDPLLVRRLRRRAAEERRRRVGGVAPGTFPAVPRSPAPPRSITQPPR
jgi:hypothetical protein